MVVTALWAFPTGHLLLGHARHRGVRAHGLARRRDGAAGRAAPGRGARSSTRRSTGSATVRSSPASCSGSPRAATTGSPRSSRSPASCSARSCRTPAPGPRGSGMTASGGIAERADRLVARARRHRSSSASARRPSCSRSCSALLAAGVGRHDRAADEQGVPPGRAGDRVKVDVARAVRARVEGRRQAARARAARRSATLAADVAWLRRGGGVRAAGEEPRARASRARRPGAAPAQPRRACARTCGTSARRSPWRR